MNKMDKIKVVCMGDSITEGYGIEDTSRNYPAMLRALLGEQYQVYNEGHSGCCVLNIELDGQVVGAPYVRVEEYERALADKGDIYVIMLGSNDAQDGMDDVEDIQDPYNNNILYEAEFEDHFEVILKAVREHAPHAKLFLCKPAPVLECIWRTHQEKYLLKLLPHYDRIISRHPEITLIDVHEAFMALSDEELHDCYQEDRLHPNEKGAALIARTVADKVLA